MPPASVSRRRRLFAFLPLSVILLYAADTAAHPDGACPFSSPTEFDHHHHHHHHHNDHDHGHAYDHDHNHDHHHDVREIQPRKLPEELAEEEDLLLNGFDHHAHHGHRGHGRVHGHYHGHLHGDLVDPASSFGVWMRAMGCSLLVSMASLVCLIILPVIFFQGKPSKAVVDSLAVFGAGAMLGDAFLHQLPHAFGGEHSHSHDHHDHNLEHGHSHAHSLKDLSVGLSVLFGVVLFFLVEKVVRYVEDVSGKGTSNFGHGHHHHKRHMDDNGKSIERDRDHKDGETDSIHLERSTPDDEDDEHINDRNDTKSKALPQKRTSSGASVTNGEQINAANGPDKMQSVNETNTPVHPSSLVFGYLNLFSDGVHNFTDGMALGSAFLLHGSIGGWYRTLFLLAHELPQEIGDFGILVRSGFTVPKALFFNFFSALVALAGTALALVLGKDPGHSSLIEGFTAGGFIYIAVAGVLPELSNGKTTLKDTAAQLTCLILGMLVALCISLVE